MYCPKCKCQIEDGSLFCSECGADLCGAQVQQPKPVSPVTPPQNPRAAGANPQMTPMYGAGNYGTGNYGMGNYNSQPPKKNNKPLLIVLIIVGALFAAVAIGVAGFFVVQKVTKTEPAVELDPVLGEGHNSRLGSSDEDGFSGLIGREEEDEQIVITKEEEETVRPEDLTVNFISKPSSFEKLNPTQAGSTSELYQQDAEDPNNVWMAMDGNSDTSWQEGVSGSGIGEQIWYSFEEKKEIKYLSFKLGNWRTKEYLEGNNRPKVLNVRVGDFSFQVEFPEEQQEYWIELSEPYPADEVEYEIVSVYKGTTWDDTCIAELGIYGE